MGRLTEAVVTHSRAQVPDAPGMPDPPDPPDIVRTTQFTYHANHRLATERVAMTEYDYDELLEQFDADREGIEQHGVRIRSRPRAVWTRWRAGRRT